MALAFALTLEKKFPDDAASAAYAKAAPGRALSREADRLDSAARRKGVTALTALLSEDPATLRAKLEADGFDPAKMRLPPEVWFDAADGLKTVRALAGYVEANMNDFKQPNPILRDLNAAAALLAAAEAAGVRFHFSKIEL